MKRMFVRGFLSFFTRTLREMALQLSSTEAEQL